MRIGYGLLIEASRELAQPFQPSDRLDDLLALNAKEPLVSSLLDLGFTSVSLDLEGLVSGKLNRGL